MSDEKRIAQRIEPAANLKQAQLAAKALMSGIPIKRAKVNGSDTPWIISVNLTPNSHNLATKLCSSDYSELTQKQKDAVFEAAKEIEANANVKFHFNWHYEQKETADVFISQGRLPNPYDRGMTNLGLTKDIIINKSIKSKNYNKSSIGYRVILHELCHALGLGHPDELGTKSPTNTDTTIMSYNDGNESVYGLRHADIQALKTMYGNANLHSNLSPTLRNSSTDSSPHNLPFKPVSARRSP